MLKKVIAIYVALAIALSGSVVIGAMVLKDIINENKVQRAMREANINTEITDLFHDQGANYIVPSEPTTEDEITFRLRSRRYNVTKAQFQFTNDRGVSWTTLDMEFEGHDNSGYFDFWKVTVPPQSKAFYYRFLVGNESEAMTHWYSLLDADAYNEPNYSKGWQVWPGFDSPEWSKGTVWYSILADAFFNGDTNLDDTTYSGILNQWSTGKYSDQRLGVKYGGDLLGLTEKISYLKNLGVESVFVNPIHRHNGNNVGYANRFFKEVEESYGDSQNAINLINELHKNDMHLMIDVDFAYIANDAAYIKNNNWVVDYTKYQDLVTTDGLTAWGGYVVDMGKPIAQNLIWTADDSALHWYVRELGADGFRFDTGGWLWGTTATADLSPVDIIKSMRYYLKKINPELFFLSESGGVANGGFDSQWNLSLGTRIPEYAKGLASANNLYASLKGTILNQPRQVACQFYNYMTQHDTSRSYSEEYQYKSAVLVLMTFVGSPCIFYGEEHMLNVDLHGTDATGNWMNSMNWNQSQWNYDYHNFYTALGDLRKEYSCLRTGVYKLISISDADNLIAYERWDENGKVVTIASQNEETTEFSIDVRGAEFKDGDVLTDWLTGKKYTVADGCVVVDVIPGGTVLVSGDKASSYRQEYKTYTIGSVKKGTDVYTDSDGKFTLEGKGSLSGTSDDVFFAGVESFNDFSVTASVDSGDGTFAIMARSSDAADASFYAAEVSAQKIVVKARTADGGSVKELATAASSNGTVVRIGRTADGIFHTYIASAPEEGEEDEALEWSAVEGSDIGVQMNGKAYAGLAPISGKVSVINVKRASLGGVVGADSFDAEHTSALLIGTDAANVTHADGYLTIEPLKDRIAYAYSFAPDMDWTFKAKVKYAPTTEGDYAGVVCVGSQNEYVAVGRTVLNGKSAIYFGKANAGKFNVIYSVEDKQPNDEIIVQLQKVGFTYTAVYSYNGTDWNEITSNYLLLNYAEEKIGPYVVGSQKASFDWVCFGDSINDGISVNSPTTMHAIDYSYASTNESKAVGGSWVNGGGTWDIADDGLIQTDKEALGIMADVKKIYTSFRAVGTFKIDEGDGWVGMGFGKASALGAPEDGFLLKYTSDHVLSLMKGKTVISSVGINEPENSRGMRFVLETQNDGTIFVYAGEKSELVILAKNTGYVNGYFNYYTSGVVAHVNNYRVTTMLGSWTQLTPGVNGVGTNLSIASGGATNLTGVGVTNFVAKVKLFATPTSATTAQANITICAPQGVTGDYGGLMISLNAFGEIILKEGGYDIDSYQLPNVPAKGKVSAYLMIVKQFGNIKIYCDNSKEPVLTYTEDYTRGGAFTLSSYGSASKFLGINITSITGTTDLKTVASYNEWMAGVDPTSGGTVLQVYKKSYATEDDLGDLNILHGQWVIKNGGLACTSGDAWNDRVNINDNAYANFIMEYEVRADGTSGWMGVSIRCFKSGGDHANDGILIYVSPNGGRVGTVYGPDGKQNAVPGVVVDTDGTPGYKRGDWYSLRIEARGTQVSVWHENTKLIHFTDDGLLEGLIRFAAGHNCTSYRNLVITPLADDISD